MTRKSGTIGGEAAENQLNVLIERRAREAEDANHAARVWAEGLDRYRTGAAAERRQAWIAWHERMERLHARLADEHGEKAAALADSEAG